MSGLGLCPHPEHSTGGCGPLCECAERIRDGTYGKTYNELRTEIRRLNDIITRCDVEIAKYISALVDEHTEVETWKQRAHDENVHRILAAEAAEEFRTDNGRLREINEAQASLINIQQNRINAMIVNPFERHNEA